LQLQEWWEKVWRVLFYLIRISFAIVLIISIVLIFVAIAMILIALSSSRDGDDNGGSAGGMVFISRFGFSPDWFWIFYPDYYDRRYARAGSPQEKRRRSKSESDNSMNFLEAVFSFLFGDGNPNTDLEERRWQAIAAVIRNNSGAVAAEQLAPYLDDLGQGYAQEYEEYMLPVLTRFNGRPEVSPEGELVYHFPELQTTVNQKRSQSVASYLQELRWRFSQAGSEQLVLAAGLGALNLVGVLALGSLLRGGIAAEIGGVVAFVHSIYWLLMAYGTGFLLVPLVRYFWIQWRNEKLSARNNQRQNRAARLNLGDAKLRHKLTYAKQFAAETVITQEDLIYTTERDMLEQDVERSAQIDAEWQRRLEQRTD
jgi:hypothetical protein